MENPIEQVLHFPLFHGVEADDFRDIQTQPEYKLKFYQYETGQKIELPCGIALVEKGSVCVYRSGDAAVLINIIAQGAMFGVSTILNDKPANTVLKAKTKVGLWFINEQTLLWLLMQDSRILKNYLAFVSKRICFLNEKLAAFSAPDTEQKLMTYLRQNQKDEKITVSSFSRLSNMLGMGRASLYRALAALQENGRITRDGKNIVLTRESDDVG